MKSLFFSNLLFSLCAWLLWLVLDHIPHLNPFGALGVVSVVYVWFQLRILFERIGNRSIENYDLFCVLLVIFVWADVSSWVTGLAIVIGAVAYTWSTVDATLRQDEFLVRLFVATPVFFLCIALGGKEDWTTFGWVAALALAQIFFLVWSLLPKAGADQSGITYARQ